MPVRILTLIWLGWLEVGAEEQFKRCLGPLFKIFVMARITSPNTLFPVNNTLAFQTFL